MIKYKKQMDPTKHSKEPEDNRFNRINDAAAKKRKGIDTPLSSDDSPSDKKAPE